MLLSASTPIGTAPLSADRLARLREMGRAHAICFGAHIPDDEDLFMSAILDGDVDPITEEHGQFWEVMEAFIQGARAGREERLTMLG
jgi:hypothetical protein